ncbi:uncharacterized protein LOC127855502 [Dreissena polymorpha]|uniref:uncharacterized protein LOC127855502 n=1 Tax=Dreissena polymorpha TaxID=45954 RepID=UPI002264FC2C|nr:uncharacterized protein LOC127855502 [Dreissena polymorpha]XP_052247110.1 uncharacterized protein LOC127855502 [Dreissena polymorpha]XP_052247111.1 uncharacterized protein LOC127855502 [Dreissena polymorpha]XP_052247112.1 uncharacterized protein LOC127855502 [Dreissena polymorpha]XP_052247113.1 uncharacterized protein LOC127855502 [Dreissena polymorpha]XP_052247114.1 uncharacterized protein LOC127855502 [Dreissena polymorpha]XP_052247115.1 uncharacterized protein LOC127855502 [Dreissena po
MAMGVETGPVFPGQTAKKDTTEHAHRKLPRPIMFWSVNEKTAYRRNRVVQTRLNKLTCDIATQRNSARKSIRFEAHKFRQKSGHFYSHPLSNTSGDSQSSGSNIAPLNWRPPSELSSGIPNSSYSEDAVSSSLGQRKAVLSPRKQGIITRSTIPSVTFSAYRNVQCIQDDSRIDDLGVKPDVCSLGLGKNAKHNPPFRSVSAVQHREIPDLLGQRRQQSAAPAARTYANVSFGENTRELTNNIDFKVNCCRTASDNFNRRSDFYFDRAKAAYQLRQDLQRRARQRQQEVQTALFTLQDALAIERAQLLRSTDRVVDFLRRVVEIQRAERPAVTKYTRDAIIQQMHI